VFTERRLGTPSTLQPPCEDAEQFIEEIRRDDAELAESLHIEPVELEAEPSELFDLVRDDELERFDPEVAQPGRLVPEDAL